MSKLRHGGPAFPATTVNDSDTNITDPFGTLLPPNAQAPYSGMTLRDYFAAKANVPRALAETKVRDRMQADGIFSPPTEEQISLELARLRYMAADAMLKVRDA